jgi:hypothetical protein
MDQLLTKEYNNMMTKSSNRGRRPAGLRGEVGERLVTERVRLFSVEAIRGALISNYDKKEGVGRSVTGLVIGRPVIKTLQLGEHRGFNSDISTAAIGIERVGVQGIVNRGVRGRTI